MRRWLGTSTIAVILCSLLNGLALAQNFPSGRVTIIVPYTAGGTADIIARSLVDGLRKLWNQPVIVENVGGAGGIVGTMRAVKSDPDGRTLLLTVQDPVIMNRFIFKNLAYDPDKSLVPITMVARGPQIVIANASFPANNMKELVEVARKTPSGLTYSSSGMGSQPFLLFETIAKRYGVKFVHVPYKGIAPAVTAVMANEVKLGTGSPPSAGGYIEGGQIKALAVSGDQRAKRFPDVPTLAEAGFAEVDASTWWGLFAPAGISPELAVRISGDVKKVAGDPDFIEKYFTKFGTEAVLDTPDEFSAAIRKDVAITSEMVKAADLKPQD